MIFGALLIVMYFTLVLFNIPVAIHILYKDETIKKDCSELFKDTTPYQQLVLKGILVIIALFVVPLMFIPSQIITLYKKLTKT